jgi:acetyl esterase
VDRAAPQVRALLERWAASETPSVTTLTPEIVRRDDRAVLELQSRPHSLHSVSDVGLGALPARVYMPTEQPRGTVLYLHGGGFVIGPEGYEAPLRELALATNCTLVAPHYRLAPEHRFPAAVEDALAAARGLTKRVGPIGVAGDSSGGNLAALATKALTRDGAAPSFQVLIYPMLDATASSPSYREFGTGYGFTREKSLWYFSQYLGAGADPRSPEISPLFDEDLGGLPPTLVVTAECDPLRDEGERYAADLERAGVWVEARRYAGMIHGFFQMTGVLDDARRLHADIGDWIARQHDARL